MDEFTAQLERQLQSAEIPSSEHARGESLKAASALLDKRRPGRTRAWSRAKTAALAAACLMAFAFTPPGRAATDWVGEKLGIVGGPPTEEAGIPGFPPGGEQIVLATGTTANDRPFEIVAYRSDKHLGGENAVCVDIVYATGPEDAAGCYGGALGYGAVCCLGVTFAADDSQNASFMPSVHGQVRPDVRRVEVAYTDESGQDHTVEAVVGIITEEFAERLGIEHPSGVFTASLPGLSDQGRLLQTTKPVEVTAYGADGEVLETESTGGSGDVAQATEKTGDKK